MLVGDRWGEEGGGRGHNGTPTQVHRVSQDHDGGACHSGHGVRGGRRSAAIPAVRLAGEGGGRPEEAVQLRPGHGRGQRVGRTRRSV